jgi:acetolactate synthase I/II/III large subunit
VTTVGQALVAGLAARGVTVVFGIPGVHTIGLYRGLPGSGIRHVTPRHEQGAGFMADGFARVTGRPGVALVITGPGVTNALTALAQARADSVPVLLISAVNAQGTLGRGLGFLHEMPDQAAMVRTLCPTFRVTAPEVLERCLTQAWAAMLGARPGPAHLELPLDVIDLPAVGGGGGGPDLPAVAGLPGPALDAAAALLGAARRPVILAGGGARRAGPALARLAEALEAPVILTTNARGLLAGHDLVVPASPSLEAVRGLMAGADGVLVVGSELGPTDCDMYARGGFPDLSGMVRVDVSAAQLARHPCAVALCGDAGEVLEALAGRLGLARHGAGGGARAAAARAAALAEVTGLHPGFALQLAMLGAVRAAMPKARIVGDSTQPVYAGNLWFPDGFPGCWFNAATGFGALGYGPPAAIGAAIADPGRPVVCLVGDGGLQFAAAELRTARDEGVGVTFLVWNNSGYREIAEAMGSAGAGNTGCAPSSLDLGPFAAACGLPFASVPADPAALAAALRQPCAGPRLIEICAP